MKVSFPIRPSVIVGVLFAVVIGFALVDLTAQYARYFPFDFPLRWRIDRLFHMGREANIPAWFSTILLMAAALLLATIALAKHTEAKENYIYWGVLSLTFLYLSMDEAAVIHEEIGDIIAQRFPSSLFASGWFVAGGIVVLVFAIFYLRFLLALPLRTKVLFLVAGLLFVGGAIGVEFLATPYENDRPADFGFAILVVIEEVLEMSGIIVFLYALSGYLGEQWPGLHLIINTKGPEETGRMNERA